MIAVDTNILVYAHRADALQHEVAAARVRELAEERSTWAIPWPCIHEFLSITTHPKIYLPPTPLIAALDQVEAWLASPTLLLLGEAPGHFERLKDACTRLIVRGPQVHDARIAALCLGAGVRELWTSDRDFSRFPQLKTRNPLVG
jgi:toxin-antitoxin system PIN domain toxin